MTINVTQEPYNHYYPIVMRKNCSYKTLEVEVYGANSFHSVNSDGSVGEWLWDSDHYDDDWTGYYQCSECHGGGEGSDELYKRHLERSTE